MRKISNVFGFMLFVFLFALNCATVSAGGLPSVSKAVNSSLPHAIVRGVERGIFPDKTSASNELKALSSQIGSGGFPSGSFVDPSYSDRVLVPVGNGGLASYQVGSNGTAKLKTVLIKN
jgi:hypothetical protein